MTSHEGMYILQWKYYDKLAHTHLSPLDTLTAAATTHVHKAKVKFLTSSFFFVVYGVTFEPSSTIYPWLYQFLNSLEIAGNDPAL